MESSVKAEDVLKRVLTGSGELSASDMEIMSRLYQLYPGLGTPSYGVATLYFNENAQSQFTEAVDLTDDNFRISAPGGIYFRLTSPYRVNPAAVPFGYITVPVVSTSVGSVTNMPENTEGVVEGVLSTYIDSVAFPSGTLKGSDRESTDTFQKRALNMTRMVSHFSEEFIRYSLTSEFPELSDVTVIGSGDSRMIRDLVKSGDTTQHAGGCLDIYVHGTDVSIGTDTFDVLNILNIDTWPGLIDDRFAWSHSGEFNLNSEMVYADDPGGPGTFLDTLDVVRGTYLPSSCYIVDMHELRSPVLGILSVTTPAGVELVEGRDYVFYQGDRATSFSYLNRPFIVLREGTVSRMTVRYYTSPLVAQVNKVFGYGSRRLVGFDTLIKHYPPIILKSMKINYSGNPINSEDLRSMIVGSQNLDTIAPVVNSLVRKNAIVQYPIEMSFMAVADTGRTIHKTVTNTLAPQDSLSGLPLKSLYRLVLPPDSIQLTQRTGGAI
jgi:hypothetical protein